MRFKSWILAAAAVVAATWAVLDSRSDQQASQRQLRQLQGNLDELKAELRHRPITALGAGAAATGDVASLARREARAEAQRAIDEQPVTTEARPVKPPPVSFEQSQAAVLEAFGQESSDPHWSADAARKLDVAVRGHLPKGGRLGSIECRATMCQVEVAHTNPGGSQAFLMNAFRDWPGSLFVAKDRQDQGEYVVTIIAAREGHEPPMAPR